MPPHYNGSLLQLPSILDKSNPSTEVDGARRRHYDEADEDVKYDYSKAERVKGCTPFRPDRERTCGGNAPARNSGGDQTSRAAFAGAGHIASRLWGPILKRAAYGLADGYFETRRHIR